MSFRDREREEFKKAASAALQAQLEKTTKAEPCPTTPLTDDDEVRWYAFIRRLGEKQFEEGFLGTEE